MKNVLIYGRTAAAYRPGLYAKYFIDRADLYSVLCVDPVYWNSYPRVIRHVLLSLFLFISAFKAEVIIITPMFHTGRLANFLMKFAGRLKRRLIIDVYISEYETKVIDRAIFAEGSKAAKTAAESDRLAFQVSSPAIFLTQAEREYYCSLLGIDAGSIHSVVNPLCVPLRTQAKLPYLSYDMEIPTVVWWGRFGNPIHGFDVIARAIQLLENANFKANYALFGANDKKYSDNLECYQSLADLPNVTFSKEYSFNNGKLDCFLLNHADLALGTFGDTRKAKTVLSNKVLDAASFGIPCLTQYSSGTMEFFKEGETILIAEHSPSALAAAIKLHFEEREKLKRIGYASLQLAESTFSPEAFEARFRDIIEVQNFGGKR